MFSYSQISKRYIEKKLKNTPYNVDVKKTVTSTNTLMKEKAHQGCSEFSVLIASQQTEGRGRLGRSFYSPSGSGIYMSILLKLKDGENPFLITTDAAVCAARVLERLSGKSAYIKWVNDIYIDEKKVCGILTEGVGKYAVLGIGINVLPPQKGFPEDIKNKAGAVFEKKKKRLREDIIIAFLDELIRIYKNRGRNLLLEEYRNRSMIIGKEILILGEKENKKATALAIADDYSLVVRKEDGETVNLSTGDVSIAI